MKVLIYGNRKQDDMMWDASTPEQEDAAFLALFRYIGDVWKVYSTLNADLKDTEKDLKELEEVSAAYTKKSMPAALMETAKTQLANKAELERSVRRQKEMSELYKKAKTGDAKAAKALVLMRKDYEYEEWSYGEVIDPVPLKKRK